MRLATWNAASGRGPDGRVRNGALAACAAALGVDVLALQEVDAGQERSGRADQAALAAAACSAADGSPWEHRFAAALSGVPGRREDFTAATGAEPAGGPLYGVALLSRYPVLSWHELRLAPGRAVLPLPLPPGSGRRVLLVPDEPRVALAAVVAAPGGAVTVVSTHLSFSPARAVAQLREVCRWTAGLPGPVVLLGDLNLPGPLPALVSGWHRLAEVATFPVGAPRLQLDHALAADPVPPVRDVRAVELPVSDHRALVVELG
ncbi:endonuclease/exonuclease/phosphatase family protein [Kineococcus sp. NUM-3379]